MCVYCAYIHLPTSQMSSFSSKIKQKIRVASLHEFSFLHRVREILEAISPKGKDLGPPGLRAFLITLWIQYRHLPALCRWPESRGRVLSGGSPRSYLGPKILFLAKKTLAEKTV